MNTKTESKRILVYGDSLTWGRIPESTERYDEKTRFTCVLQLELGKSYEVVEEGLRGRMVFGENARLPHRNGFDAFPGIFLSHTPLDLVVIALGTNDTQKAVDKTASQISSELEKYIKVIKNLSNETHTNIPKILYLIPPQVRKKSLQDGTKFEGAEKKTKEMINIIRDMANKNQVYSFDSNLCVSTSNKDGVHLSHKGNISLGKALANEVLKIMQVK